MNQDNNYNFDPMTGQPVQQSSTYQQVPQQQQPKKIIKYL